MRPTSVYRALNGVPRSASLVEAMLETGVAIPSMCLSAHRRFPFGSREEIVRERAREIMTKAIRLARDLGIRTIQLAGYDVYYEEHDEGTQQRFAEGLAWAVEQAAAAQVMLAVEIMDTAFMNSISKWKSGTTCSPRRGSAFTRTSAT